MSYASLDALWLLLSLGKLIEVALLWRGRAILLAQITFSCWLFLFISSIVLAVHDVFFGVNNLASKSEIDIVGRSLPSSSTPGSARTAVLGIPKRTRRFLVWRIVWSASTIVSIASTIGTYIALSQAETVEVFFDLDDLSTCLACVEVHSLSYG
jgi:hypothetical protein